MAPRVKELDRHKIHGRNPRDHLLHVPHFITEDSGSPEKVSRAASHTARVAKQELEPQLPPVSKLFITMHAVGVWVGCEGGEAGERQS